MNAELAQFSLAVFVFCEWMEKERGTEHRADQRPLIIPGKRMLIFKDSTGIQTCVLQPHLKLMFHGVDSL